MLYENLRAAYVCYITWRLSCPLHNYYKRAAHLLLGWAIYLHLINASINGAGVIEYERYTNTNFE
jgi:hypothetical protein